MGIVGTISVKERDWNLLGGPASGLELEIGTVGTVFPGTESTEHRTLEAQQRYFSYRARLVAIVSQNYFVLVIMGYRTIVTRYVAKWGIDRYACAKLST